MSIIKRKILTLISVIKKPEMEILPGNLAFSLVISITPVLTLFVLLASFLPISTDTLMNFMIKTFPQDVSDILIPFMNGTGFNLNVGVYLIIGFMIASNGLYSVITSSNTLYKKESSTTIKRRIKAVMLAIMLVFLFIFILIVLAFGNSILKLFITLYPGSEFFETLYAIYVFMKWPLGFVAIFFNINLIYAFAPDSLIPSKYTRKGALFTTFAWMIVTSIYSYYVSNIANYDAIYGGLSSIMVMMIWIYILSFVFVLGIALNASNYKMAISTNNNES
ncbi:MAG: YihY/virulence factor BrkB family protein [Bacilli bacterium]